METHISLDLNNLIIQLPTNKIIIDKTEYEALQSETLLGRYMTMSEVLAMLSVSRPWFLDNVLYNDKFRNMIDIDRDSENGFVKYPSNQGGRYYFLASKTRVFFEHHFQDIFN